MATWRRRAGKRAGLVLSLAFAALLIPIVTAEVWLGISKTLVVGERAPVTVRLPHVGAVPTGDSPAASRARIAVARGDRVSPEAARLTQVAQAYRHGKPGALTALFVAFSLIGILLTAYLRTLPRGAFLRTQITVLASLLVVAALSKAYLLLTPLSVFLIPAGALPLLVGALVDKNAGLGCAIAFSLVVSSLSPFDAPVAIVLSAQGIGALLAFTRAKHKRSFFVSALASALAASGAYVATTFLYAQDLSLVELKDPIHSALLASAAGGLLAGPVALFLRPSVERLLGEVPRSRLIEHADLESPLLKQIAARAPGTWQHSLAMANMAEITANAIGANALLVRVGAYYHDLGKSLNSQFYIENLEPGQQSPHDQIPPEASAEAIYRHVTEGIRVARERGLPEAIVDFMLMHHGDGILEYFWSKCQEQGNPRKLTIDTFRYPGVRPQTRETAILAICDAVEAASRSLKQPNARAILALVQRIVYGKLHLGQLDDSGLTMAELRTIANTLVEILKHAHHVRIEYPWQREEAAVHQGATQAMGAGAPTAAPDTGDVGADASAPATTMAVSASQGITMSGRPPKGRVESTVRFLTEHVLDSADAPRPFWDNGREGRDGRAAPELPVDSGVAQSLSFEAEKSAPTVAPAIPSHSMPPPRRRT